MPLSQDVNLKTLRRFFIRAEAPVTALPHAASIEDSNTVHHARSVLRLNAGDVALAVDAERETAWLATIEALDRNSMRLILKEPVTLPSDPLPPVHLGCALIKEQRWDWLIQKATELGVRSITPLQTEHCIVEVKDPRKKQQRWQQVLQGAAEQSEGLFIPDMKVPAELSDFCESLPKNALKLFLAERPLPERMPIGDILKQYPQPDAIAAVIGPEGGWSDTETQLLLDSGFRTVSLGDRILKTETAAITLMAILRHAYAS